jgi:predicted transcriptional regulator
MKEHILEPMKQILVELDDELAARLERVAPGRSRKRSEFVRTALAQALWDIEEKKTAEAYRRQPDSEGAFFDAGVWEPAPALSSRRPRRR